MLIQKLSLLAFLLLYRGLVFSYDIPLTNKNNWQLLKYSGITANTVSFNKNGLNLEVNSSASPLIYPFKIAKQISEVTINAKVIGKQLSFSSNKTQGEKGSDDFHLRLGLVETGTRTLPWYKKALAPKWVIQLFNLAPQGTGINKITFLTAVNQSKLLNKTRTHPANDLLFESYETKIQKDGSIIINKLFKKPLNILAIWIAVDGDDTKAHYSTLITKINLK